MKKIAIAVVAASLLSAAGGAAGAAAWVEFKDVVAAKSLVIVTGEAQLENDAATVTLPDWFESQTKAEGRSVFLSNRGASSSPLRASAVANGQFTVKVNGEGQSDQEFSWLVVAERK